MGILSWVVLGLSAGLLARLLLPGRGPEGIVVTILLGIAGALVGGFLGTRLFGINDITGLDLRSIALAVASAVLLLVVYGALKRAKVIGGLRAGIPGHRPPRAGRTSFTPFAGGPIMWKVVRGVLLAVVAAGILGVLSFQAASGQQKKGADKSTEAKAPVFEIYKDKGGKFRFRLTQGNDLLAMSGHGFATREDCQKVIETIKRVAARAKIEDDSK